VSHSLTGKLWRDRLDARGAARALAITPAPSIAENAGGSGLQTASISRSDARAGSSACPTYKRKLMPRCVDRKAPAPRRAHRAGSRHSFPSANATRREKPRGFDRHADAGSVMMFSKIGIRRGFRQMPTM